MWPSPACPRALAVVNPNRLDDDSPHGQMAAVGVAFLLAVAVNRELREADGTATARRRTCANGWTWWRWAPSATWCR